MPDQPTYIVTGGAGFVGSSLCAALRAREPLCRLIVVDDFRSGSFANIVEAFARAGLAPFDGTVIASSVADIDHFSLLAESRAAVVFHEAAITDTTVMDERRMVADNSDAFVPLLAACAGHGVRLVYASSAATYGTPPEAGVRRAFELASAGQPNNVYGFSKWLMECEHRRAASAAPREPWVVGLRYFNVFGPGEARKGKMASMVYQLAQQMLRGERPRVFVDGTQARDQVYIEDVVGCTMAAAGLGERSDPEPGVYNVGSGAVTSFDQVVAALRVGLGISEVERPTEYFEMPALVRSFYQDYTCADMSETKAGLGWTPRWSASDAIALYAEMMREEYRARHHPA